jgi:hypothetical protein
MWAGAEKSQNAINDLVGQTLEGRVKSVACRSTDDMPTDLPCAWWKDYTLAEDGPGNLVPHRVGVGGYFNVMPDRRWNRVAFARDDVLGVWLTADALSVSREVATAAATAQSPSSEGFDCRPRPTDQAVRQWMRNRVTNWPDNLPAPSEECDWSVVAKHFSAGLTRDEFRLVRESETPGEWRKQGPRKRWGQVRKSANQSANLRPQN